MRARHWIMLSLLSVLWGGTFIFVKEALTALPPVTITLARCVIAAAILMPVVLAVRLPLPKTARAWRDFAVMSLLNNVIPFGLIISAQRMIPSGLASVINAATPLMTLLVAKYFAGDALPAHKVGGLALGIVGVATLVGPSAFSGDSASAVGMGMVLAGTLSYGFSALWGRRFSATSPLVSAAVQVSCAALILLPLAIFGDRFWQLPVPPSNVIVAVLALGALSTALAYVLFFRIMAEAGSNTVMLVTLLIPISAVSVGALRFGERLSINQFAGAAIIAASLLLLDGRLFGFGVAKKITQPA